MKRPAILAAALAFGIGVAGTQEARAAITIGGLTFDDDAFADVLLSSTRADFFITVGGTLDQVLTDKNPGTYAFSRDPEAFVELGFTDNAVINGPGADLALFEVGLLDSLRVTIAGATRDYLAQPTGDIVDPPNDFSLNVALVDLDDFGIPAGGAISSVLIGLAITSPTGTVPSLSLVGALNSGPPTPVPEPGSLALLTAGLLGLGFVRRRTA